MKKFIYLIIFLVPILAVLIEGQCSESEGPGCGVYSAIIGLPGLMLYELPFIGGIFSTFDQYHSFGARIITAILAGLIYVLIVYLINLVVRMIKRGKST